MQPGRSPWGWFDASVHGAGEVFQPPPLTAALARVTLAKSGQGQAQAAKLRGGLSPRGAQTTPGAAPGPTPAAQERPAQLSP